MKDKIAILISQIILSFLLSLSVSAQINSKTVSFDYRDSRFYVYNLNKIKNCTQQDYDNIFYYHGLLNLKFVNNSTGLVQVFSGFADSLKSITIPDGQYDLYIWSDAVNCIRFKDYNCNKIYGSLNILLSFDPFYSDTLTIYEPDLQFGTFTCCHNYFNPNYNHKLLPGLDESRFQWFGASYFSWNYFNESDSVFTEKKIKSVFACNYYAEVKKPSLYMIRLIINRLLFRKENVIFDKVYSKKQNFIAVTYADKGKSFINSKYKNQQELLYNQVLFNLTELHVRYFRKFLSEHNAVIAYDHRYEILFDYREIYERMILEFNIETGFGSDFAKLKEYHNKVNKELLENEKYKWKDLFPFNECSSGLMFSNDKCFK